MRLISQLPAFNATILPILTTVGYLVGLKIDFTIFNKYKNIWSWSFISYTSLCTFKQWSHDRKCLPFVITWVYPRVLVGSMLHMFIVCSIVLCCVCFVFLFVYCFLCFRSVSCSQCCLCLWIIHFWFPPRFSLTFIGQLFHVKITRNL